MSHQGGLSGQHVSSGRSTTSCLALFVSVKQKEKARDSSTLYQETDDHSTRPLDVVVRVSWYSLQESLAYNLFTSRYTPMLGLPALITHGYSHASIRFLRSLSSIPIPWVNLTSSGYIQLSCKLLKRFEDVETLRLAKVRRKSC